MSLSRLTIACAIVWGILSARADAQEVARPAVRPVGYAGGYYYQPEASPSDKKPPKPMADDDVPPAPMPAAPMSDMAPAEPAAEEEAEEEETCDPWRLFCQKECGWNFHGFAAGGIMANSRGPADNFNGPVTFADRDSGQFNQLYMILEKAADNGGCGWGFGGRVDALYGSDYVFTMATGLELTTAGAPKWNIGPNGNAEYGLALPQFYADVVYNDLSVKLGHFYTVLGYEVVPANGNFFYTHAYTMQHGEPFTHTGALATYKYSDSTNLVAGLVNGWDNFDRDVDTGAAILGFTWKNCDETLNIAYNICLSPNEPVLLGVNAGLLTNRNCSSLVVSKTFGCEGEWQYVFQNDIGWQHQGAADGTGAAEWYGINQYLFYTVNDCWKFGGRFEWFRDDDGARVTGLRNTGNSIFGQSFVGNFYEMSLGANYTPTANLTIRPELRYDWFEGTGTPFNNNTGVDQFLFGFDAIFLF